MTKESLIKLLLVSLLLAFPLAASANGKRANGPAYQNELLVIGAIKQLYAAEYQYLFNVPPPPDQLPGPQFGSLQRLRDAGLIDPVLGSGEKFGYNFHIITLGRSSGSPPNIIVNAWPRVYRKTGIRSFFMNIDCGIKGADHGGSFAEWTDPVIDSCSPTIAYEYGTQSMADLRTIASAEFTYQAAVGNGHFGSWDQLIEAGLISENMRLNYHRTIISTTKPTLTTPATFKIWSTPTVYRTSGVLSLFIDDTGILRGSDRGGRMAEPDDPPIMLNPVRNNNES